MDLCTNIRCDNNRLFRELVRVLRKLPTPPKYERKFYKQSDKKKANRYNKHYIRFHCGTHDLVIYDKTHQVKENELAVAYEKLPKGVLRFEVHCERAYIRNICKKLDDPNTAELLWYMIENSEALVIDHFSRCFPDAEFAQKEELERRIKTSAFKGENKELMLELVNRLERTQSVDKALKKMDTNGYDTSKILKKFSKLGISPIPLRKNFCAENLPGPVELLRNISERNLEVEYVELKCR